MGMRTAVIRRPLAIAGAATVLVACVRTAGGAIEGGAVHASEPWAPDAP